MLTSRIESVIAAYTAEKSEGQTWALSKYQTSIDLSNRARNPVLDVRALASELERRIVEHDVDNYVAPGLRRCQAELLEAPL